MIAYLFAGGLEKSLLPCLFNCNYESRSTLRFNDCLANWANSGARVWNSEDTYQQGETVVYYYIKRGVVTRAFYTAQRDITTVDLHPRYQQSGWHRCQDVTMRRADRNGIADGTEEYLLVLWEYLTRYCTSCQISRAPQETVEDINDVDPETAKNFIDVRGQRPNNNLSSGILGEDGEEIIF